jgi:hypothetical protein
MIIWDKKNGYTYEDEQTHKRYSTYEAKCYQGEATSDIVIIWDDKNNCVANYVYGATFLHESIEELNNTIKFYVDDYEAKRSNPSKARAFIKYEFTKAGIEAFKDRASADFFAEMDNGGEHIDKFDIVVSCGKHSIRIPLGAEEWSSVETMLGDCLEVNK